MTPEHFDLVVDRTLRSAMRMHVDLQRYRLRLASGECSRRQYARNCDAAKEAMRVAIRAALNERLLAKVVK